MMICQTCNGKGIRFEPVLVGDQYEAIPHPCPSCHAGCQHCCDGDTMPTPPTHGESANAQIDSVD
jgi:hypothetical protein